MTIIETDRLILRHFKMDDSAFVLELLNTPGWLRFIGDRNVRSIEAAESYILSRVMSCYTTFGFGMYLVELKDSHMPVGMCGLLKRETLMDVDIGFAFHPSHVGKGYAQEAAQATMNYAKEKLGLKRVVAITNSDNESSQKLLKKLGMNFIEMVKLNEDEAELMLFGNYIQP